MNNRTIYHLVTRNKMTSGQSIHLGKDAPNTLARFFFEKQIVNSKGEDFYQILNNNYSDGQIILGAEDAELAARYADVTSRAVREVILEMVRLQDFPQRPSRLSCLYGARTVDEALRWKDIFESHNRKALQIARLTFDGNYFEGDGDSLPSLGGEPFSVKIQQAQVYWRGNTGSALREILVDGNIRVIEIVEEFG
jgi:hypothetical protein